MLSLDKACENLANVETVAQCGGCGSTAFKGGTTGAAGWYFAKAFHYFR